MKILLVSQLFQAVLVIIVTIITVRYTQLGSLGISREFKAKAAIESQKALLVIGPLVLMCISGFMLYAFVYHLGSDPVTRKQVFYIAFYTAILLVALGEFASTIGQVWRYRNLGKRSEK
jgi:hypothetical protein